MQAAQPRTTSSRACRRTRDACKPRFTSSPRGCKLPRRAHAASASMGAQDGPADVPQVVSRSRRTSFIEMPALSASRSPTKVPFERHRVRHARGTGAGRHSRARARPQARQTVSSRAVDDYANRASQGAQDDHTVDRGDQQQAGQGRAADRTISPTPARPPSWCHELLARRALRQPFLCQPAERPHVHTFITEYISPDTWIYFPLDLDLRYMEPIREGGGHPAGKS